MLVACVKNFSGMLALRWFVGEFSFFSSFYLYLSIYLSLSLFCADVNPGMAESALLPLVIYYLTTFYRRLELGRRLAIFYSASSIANAFSGLLAFGTFQIHGTKLEPWRWLFVVEGAATLVCACFILMFLPRNAQTAGFLTAEEKSLAYRRLQLDSSSVVGDKLNVRVAAQIFKRPTTVWF